MYGATLPIQRTVGAEQRRASIPREQAAGPPHEAIAALLQRWLPGLEIRRERADSGGSTPVYRVEVPSTNEVFYLRLAEEAGERREAEARVHGLLRAAGLPVPEVVVWEPAPPELDRAATLTRAIPGAALRDCVGLDPSAGDGVVRAAGRDLARINQVPVRGFGWVEAVAAPDATLVAAHPTRAAWTTEYERAVAKVAASGSLPGATMTRLREALTRWGDQPDATAAYLAHGDFDATHIYVDPSSGAYTGVIDFGEIRGADQLYDLGHVLLQDCHPGTRAIFPGILAGYRELAPLPNDVIDSIRDQAVAVGTRQLARFLARAAPQTPDLASALATLLDASG